MADIGGETSSRQIQDALAVSVGAGPRWFREALMSEPQQQFVDVAGARLEALCWGESGNPGLLLAHGSAASADLWRFIAPFFADRYRVVALSWSGMGHSDWRASYALSDFAADALGVAEACGLFASGHKPVFVGHSMGGGPMVYAARYWGERLAGVVVIDSYLQDPESVSFDHQVRDHRVYPDQQSALRRYRLSPAQPCDNKYLIDFIARTAVRHVSEGGEDGWTWRFDPKIWRTVRACESWPLLNDLSCPLSLIYAEYSVFVKDGRLDRLLDYLDGDVSCVVIPEAHHHLMLDQPMAFVAVLRLMLGDLFSVSGVGGVSVRS